MDTFTSAVELRADPDKGSARLVGVLMRYGSLGQRGREVFAEGSLKWPDNGIRIDANHGSSPALGATQIPLLRTIPLESADGSEVRIDAVLPDTQQARDLAVLMRADPPIFNSMSVEFHCVRSRMEGDRRVVEDARLVGAGLVDSPSYENTSVEVRSEAKRRRIWL